MNTRTARADALLLLTATIWGFAFVAQRVAMDHLSGKPEITEGLLNHIEVAIRAYDPCLSCATHALGQMPLVVELIDADGKRISSRSTME